MLPQEIVVSMTPLKRAGTLPDIGGTCIYLSSRAGAWVTGGIQNLDGGMSIGSARL